MGSHPRACGAARLASVNLCASVGKRESFRSPTCSAFTLAPGF
jgi:hypothetical protein